MAPVVTKNENFFETIMSSIPARVALLTFLKLFNVHPMHLGVSSWQLLWFALGQLRDCTLLPPKMVLDADVDLLSRAARQEFESRMIEMEGRHRQADKPLKSEKKSTSILSLQGLGEAFFGVSAETADVIEREPTLSSRWDVGYETSAEATSESRADASNNSPEGITGSSSAVAADGEPRESGRLASSIAAASFSGDFRIPKAAFGNVMPEGAASEFQLAYIEATFKHLR